MNFKTPRVIVVGAGIVGSSIAYHLARKNARVTLIDKAPYPAHDVTEKSFAWITAAHESPEAYFNLRQQAICDWHRIEGELNGQLQINWSGALTWHENIADTPRIVSELLNFECKVRLVDRQEIRHLEPNLKQIPDQAIFAKGEGAIDPRLTTEILVEAAREAGAIIQLKNEVISFITEGLRITGVVTLNGIFRADIVVLAAGNKTTELCQQLNLTVPVSTSPAIVMQFENARQFVNRIISGPLMELRAASATLTLAAEDYIDESIENNSQAIALRTLENIKKHWRGAEQIKLKNVMVGMRPIPRDGLPIIGRTHISGLYLSVMHTGITLAAIIGRLAASEIIGDQEHILLSSYRLNRFN